MRLPSPPLKHDPSYLPQLIRAIERELGNCVRKVDGAVEINEENPLHITGPDGSRYRLEVDGSGSLALVTLP